MKTRWTWLLLLTLPFFLPWHSFGDDKAPKGETAFPSFRMQEIETGLKVGYAVLIADINNDGKPDIVVVDANRVVWYENPTWKRRTIIEGQTKPDNVCIAAYDIDGDGLVDLALGADWKPFNTQVGGTIQWLRRGKTLDDPWIVDLIATEPTVHRMLFADLDGKGMALIVAPLMGRDSTAKNNWTDGSPVRIIAFRIPKDPTRDRWMPEVISENLHVVHGISLPILNANTIYAASYEGITEIFRTSERWSSKRRADGNQANPKSNRGTSEIAKGVVDFTKFFYATIEPWHGHQVVLYTQDFSKPMWDRHVIDEKLKWGHAIQCAYLAGDNAYLAGAEEGSMEIIVGVRDNLSDKPGERRGVRIYKALNKSGTKWARHIVEDGGVAVEALAVADLNGDGRPDIVAAGRQTGNVRIYWNEGVKK